MNDYVIDRMKCDCEQGELYEDLLRETERLNLMKRPEPRKLRFPLGACVQCKMSTGWKSGVVVQHWYKPNAVAVRELDLNPRARFPYQIQLDGKNGEEGLIFAPEDVDDCIRRPKTTKAEPRPLLRFNINDLVLVLVRKGVWSSGKIVKHWSLGELEGKAKVNKRGDLQAEERKQRAIRIAAARHVGLSVEHVLVRSWFGFRGYRDKFEKMVCLQRFGL